MTKPLLHICRLKQQGQCDVAPEDCAHAIEHERFHQPVCNKPGYCPEIEGRVSCMVVKE